MTARVNRIADGLVMRDEVKRLWVKVSQVRAVDGDEDSGGGKAYGRDGNKDPKIHLMHCLWKSTVIRFSLCEK